MVLQEDLVMKTDNKIYITIIIGFLLLTAAYFLIYIEYKEDEKQKIIEDLGDPGDSGDSENNILSVKFIIDYGNGTTTEENLDLDLSKRTEPYTVFEVLNNSFNLKNTHWISVGGNFIDCIGGVCSDHSESRYWFFFVNKELAGTGTSDYYLRDNDIITMNYTYNVWF